MNRKLFGTALFALLLVSCGGDSKVTGLVPQQASKAVGIDAVTGASITTNQDDYLPGEVVHLTGAGWGAGETVHLNMTEDPDTHPDISSDVVADDQGAFSIHFYDVQTHDLGVTFTLTAAGQTSGSKATVVFTDGRAVSSATLNGVGAVTVAPSTAISANVLGALNGNANNTLGSISIRVSVDGASPATWVQLLCYDVTPNLGPSNPPAQIPFNVTFAFNAPVAPNVYDVEVNSYGDDACTTGASTPHLLDSGITVGASNVAPVLGAIGGQSVVEGNLLTFAASATDDGFPAPPALTYTLAAPATGTFPPLATMTTAGVFTWTPTEADGPGVYRAKVIVSDGALQDEEEIEITVTEGNAAPVLNLIGSQSVNELAPLTFTASASDSDIPANTLTYSLGGGCANPVGGNAAITSVGVFTWTPTEADGPGVFCARIVVSDGTTTDSEDVQITVAEVNVAPVLTPIGAQGANEEAPFSFNATASDADIPANTLTYSLGAGCANPVGGNAAITSGGAFTWTPTESDGPGVYCARVQVSDGALSDVEDVLITVAEVNKAPVLTAPASFSVNWGSAIPATQATATDPDLPANTLTFSLVSSIAGMTINPVTGVISWTPTGAQVGIHTITVRVTDNGAPALYDEDPTFTITVTTHATSLQYNGTTAGQYSDQAKLSATLTDQVTGTPISGVTLNFTFNASAPMPGTTNASGKAEVTYTVGQAAGSYNVASSFAGTSLYAAAGPTSTSFTVSAENASIIGAAGNVGAILFTQPSITLVFNVKETNPEPVAGDGALAGNIANAAATLSANLNGVATGNGPNGVCTAGTVSGSGYSGIKPFTCVFSAPVGGFLVDAYTINLGTSNGYYAGTSEDVISVYDPDAGFVSGGGKFIDTDNNRVSFGMSFTYTGKGKTGYRGGWVVIKHFADGSICRVKSNTMNAPAVSGNTASLSGKSNYSCVNALGATTASAGNLSSVGWVQDNGTSGIGVDKFWINAGTTFTPTSANYLNMTAPATTNAKLLTGGNIQVPQPGGR